MFAPDTEASLLSSAQLVNTLPDASHSRSDEMSTPASLARFLDEWGFTGSRTGDETELEQVRALRPRLRALMTASPEDLPAAVNAVLAEERALPQLTSHDEWGWHLHATPETAPVAARIRVETAMALVDLVRLDEASRIKVCAAEDCAAIVIDLSKNRSKRFCDVGNCGNRVNVNAYRARKAAALQD
ncbi:MAG TPA: CGNR zinc finger domain-containing protein [Naasia sp.]